MAVSALKNNVFADLEAKAWPLLYAGEITFDSRVIGGTPTDENVAKSWLASRLAEKGDDQIQEMVNQIMAERGVTKEVALEEVQELKLLKGFKADELGLFIDGRCFKSCLKEAVSIAAAAGKIDQRKYGMNNAGAKSFVAEHIMVVEERLYLKRDGKHITEPDGVQQRFVRTFRGSGITHEEYCESTPDRPVSIDFTIKSDWGQDFTREWWGIVMLTANLQGFGATRSQGFGRFVISRWDMDQRGDVAERPKAGPKKAAPKKAVKGSAAAPAEADALGVELVSAA